MNIKSKSTLEKLKLELRVKLGVRILIAIVIGIPTLPILYVIFAILKLEVSIVVSLPFIFLFGWLAKNREATQLGIHTAKIMLFVMIAPFLFWAYYIIGCNPIVELEMYN